MLLLDRRYEESGRSIAFSVHSRVEEILDASQRISAFCDENQLSPQRSMLIFLSLEEMLVSIKDHSFPEDETQDISIRILILPGRTPEDQETITLRIRCSGAPHIIACVRDAYGDTYVKPYLYTEKGILHHEESGELCFSVAETPDGQIVGITAYAQSGGALSGPDEWAWESDEVHDTLFLRARTCGEAFLEHLAAALQAAAARKDGTVNLFLSLSRPGSAAAYEEARRLGFFPTGILPWRSQP